MIQTKIKLEPAYEKLVRDILQKVISTNSVWAFGSRVHGNPKPHSDLDLVIIDQPALSEETLALIKLNFEESTLPFRVDVLVWSELSPEFKTIIKKNYMEF